MAAHHVDLPEQVVTPGEELWVKIIDIDLQRRRISLSIKQAAEGGEVAEEYREAFGEHAYDDQGNYIGYDYSASEFTPDNESQAAWADLVAANEAASAAASVEDAGPVTDEAITDEAVADEAVTDEAVAEVAVEADEPLQSKVPEAEADPTAPASDADEGDAADEVPAQ
jgi:small subunit ribosomal protein S1